MPENTQAPRRPGLDAASARIRSAVRSALSERPAAAENATPAPVFVALSGGPDSLALADALAFEARAADIPAGAIVIDHGLQDGSAVVAERAAEVARGLGLDPVVVRRVSVGSEGGPEAAAREARYVALREIAAEQGADTVLLGHTRDDQAETVLLGLARGSGARSLAGMAPRSGIFARPLLGIDRHDTVASCAAREHTPWIDPHNFDHSYARVRVRETVLPLLEAELGPGIVRALARTADQAREDADAFDDMIEEFIEEIVEHAEAGIAVSVQALAANPAALRNRIIRLVAHGEFGVSLERSHTLEIAELVTRWRGQGPLDVPGIRVHRENGLIVFTAADAIK
ncbi:tRNA lysidine(34) synthetase TilS [Mycetocola tolaasinivorans]|uniref:tRNA(Ile)-lysidine synthase n=1 Tax=Mycetocola tolaasinivorans TaxID=76635 RepID=A0A3L6ZV23_9MICO|nr:tRNA lysidine(34) synthetase TilS [Mycetocola tolaasinivorans]RLP71833.1 tRNA lysidine(34) synthetase TilS [Mycetocola tolaasinivorans]